MSDQAVLPNHYLSDKAVASRYGISRATVWRWAKEQPTFPRPVKLAGCTRWRSEELQKWETQQEKTSATDAVAAA